ncbi:MAG: sigma-70 family RNA polymerase sigma factor [Myxococcota bacterium]
MNKSQLKRYMGVIYARCCEILGDRDLAWDAVQESMLRYTQVAQREQVENTLALLYRISGFCCVDLQRKHYRTRALCSKLQHHLGPPEQKVNAAEGKLVLERLVQRFGKEDVALLTFRHIDQMTYQEIAQIMNQSDRGVQKKIARIEERVRKYLSR